MANSSAAKKSFFAHTSKMICVTRIRCTGSICITKCFHPAVDNCGLTSLVQLSYRKKRKNMLILWPSLVSQCSVAKNFTHCPKSVDSRSRVLTRSNRLQKRVLMKLCSDQISEEVETSTKIAQPTRKIEGFD